MIFHLAIPSRDLDESAEFYQKLGAYIGRKYSTHIVMDFLDAQIVCHQSGEWDRELKMYPRHFGVVLPSKSALEQLWQRWCHAKFIFEEYFIRHEGKQEEHHTFFLKDPSNNIIEFKWYKNSSSVF